MPQITPLAFSAERPIAARPESALRGLHADDGHRHDHAPEGGI